MQSTAGEKCCSPLPTPDDRSTCRRRSSRPEHISKTTESAATTTSAGEKEEKIKRNQTLPAICVTSTDVAGRDNMAYTATDAEDSSSSRRWSHYYGSTFEEKTAARPAAALQEEEPWYIDVVHHIWPVTTQQWRRAPWYSRAFMLLKVPVQVVLFCIIPLVDNNEPSGMRNWCKWLHVWHLVFSPAFCVFLFTSWNDTTFFGIFPLYVAVLTVSSVLALLLAIFTKRHEPPRRKFHSLFALLGFLVAVSVIYKVANEIVGVLTALGVVFRLSPAMLGLTLLAWGNAVPELISSYALARRSYQRVAISSCYAGPMFAALVGTGLAYTIGAGRMKDKTIVFSAGPVSMLLAFYLLGVLVLSLVAIPLQRFSPKRWFGFLLVGLYALFLPIIVLTELKVF